MSERKRLGWLPVALMLLPVLLLGGLGYWMQSRQMVVTEAKFRLLERPRTLPASVLTRSAWPLKTLEMTLLVSPQSIRPGWWGEKVQVVTPRVYVKSGQGKGWWVFYSNESLRFDTTKQQYVVVCECIIPDDEKYTRTGRVKADFSFWNQGAQLASFQVNSSLEVPVVY